MLTTSSTLSTLPFPLDFQAVVSLNPLAAFHTSKTLKLSRSSGSSDGPWSVVCDHLDLIAVNLIFDQVNATSVIVGENTKRLSFHEFLGALGRGLHSPTFRLNLSRF